MLKRVLVVWTAVSFLGVAALGFQSPGVASTAGSPERALLDTYCVTCHNPQLRTADLDLSALDVGNLSNDAPIWRKVSSKLREGLMPPAGMPRPNQDQLDSFLARLEAELGPSDGAALAGDAGPVAAHPTSHRELLDRFCVTCHNQQLRTAELLLDEADVEDVWKEPAIWEKVVRKLRAAAMPPVGMPRPASSTVDQFVTYLESELDRRAAAKSDPGRTAVHRLNRGEYANAVRDLLAVQIDGAEMLPADDASHGFDNNADVLSVSPLLMERYMSAARKISRLAVGDREIRVFTETYDVSRRLVQSDRMSEDLPFGSRGGIAINHQFPLDGEYVVKVRLQRNNDNYIRGLGEPHHIEIRLDGKRVQRFTIGGEHKGRSSPVYSFINKDYVGDPEQEKYEFTADAGLEVRFSANAGQHIVGVSFLKSTTAPEGVLVPPHAFHELLSFKGGEPAVDSVAISGPYDPKGLGETPSRSLIFECLPSDPEKEEPCARRILSRLAQRAYRRPVSETDLETLLRFYEIGRKERSFEAGIRTAIRGILVSPEFLFRVEREPDGLVPGTPYRVDDFDLASRLSFFLWSSIPDDLLLGLAQRGQLQEPEVLQGQVVRMLADSRSNALAENFVEQWLGLRRLAAVSPDPKEFPHFDENLRKALQQETKLFAESILREDRSILDFLDSDTTFLNERLAKHYGVPDVYGSGFRQVALSDPVRRGLLGQGSILTVTSYANRTAPTLRGQWVLENILGTPPPPPPPDVPSLKEANSDGGRILTMRERMEAHRVNPSCAVCHSRMDPLGFALENFDAIGQWREALGTTPIDSSGELTDGSKFQGPVELRHILLDRRHQFVQTLTEKLLTYALGRGLEYFDQPVVRTVMREAEESEYRWSSLVLGVVKSTPFQMRRSSQP